MTDEQNKHLLRIVQDRLRMYSDLEPEDIAKLMLMARRGMKVKNPDRLLVVNKAQAANIAFLDNENDKLRAALREVMQLTEAKTTTAVEPVNTTAIHAIACRALKEVNHDR